MSFFMYLSMFENCQSSRSTDNFVRAFDPCWAGRSSPHALCWLLRCAKWILRPVLLAILLPPAALQAGALGIMVPAYFYPRPNSDWNRLNSASAKAPLIAIMNPGNGPGTSANGDYSRAINALRAAGGRVIGYVYSSYANRPMGDIKADVDRYHSFYEIDGFFIDEMTNDDLATHYAFYAEMHQHIKGKRPTYLVVGNPGTRTRERYLSQPVTEKLVTFEHNTGYEQYVPDAWNRNYPAEHFVHLAYSVSSAGKMTNYVRLAAERNAGFIYVTDDELPNPWDRLPSYWEAHVNLIQELNRPRVSIIRDFGNIQIEVCGAPGLRYVTEISTNLMHWRAINTNRPASGKYAFSEMNAGHLQSRFYRVAQ